MVEIEAVFFRYYKLGMKKTLVLSLGSALASSAIVELPNEVSQARGVAYGLQGQFAVGNCCNQKNILENGGYRCYHVIGAGQPQCRAICGDGLVRDTEVCDSVTGCDPLTCQPLFGWDCVDNICFVVCGDGYVIEDEECDFDKDVNAQPYWTANGCDYDTCTALSGWTCVPATNTCTLDSTPSNCGNGNLDTGETCDYGAQTQTYWTNNGCNFSTCVALDGWYCSGGTCSRCGNGVVDSGEDCDFNKTVVPVNQWTAQGCIPGNCKARNNWTCVNNVCTPN